jgi:hypothetical protein
MFGGAGYPAVFGCPFGWPWGYDRRHPWGHDQAPVGLRTEHDARSRIIAPDESISDPFDERSLDHEVSSEQIPGLQYRATRAE